jgi:hypothetical protein
VNSWCPVQLWAWPSDSTASYDAGKGRLMIFSVRMRAGAHCSAGSSTAAVASAPADDPAAFRPGAAPSAPLPGPAMAARGGFVYPTRAR